MDLSIFTLLVGSSNTMNGIPSSDSIRPIDTIADKTSQQQVACLSTAVSFV